MDSTPVECGRSHETVKRSDLAGWAQYGYCASHTRYFWGLRLYLVRTLHGLLVAFAFTGAKTDERETLLDPLDAESQLPWPPPSAPQPAGSPPGSPAAPLRARTVALIALVGAQLGQTLLGGGRSRAIVVSSVGSLAALAAVIQTPGLSQFFGCTPLGPIA